jgi:hypothetical protein
LSKVLKDVSENFDFFTEKEWMIFWPSAFELLCVVKGRSRLNFEYIYLKHSMEDVGIFSLTARTMVNRIHEEVASYDLSWKSIFGSEDHISKFTKGIIGESSNSNFGEMEELVKIFLMSKCNSEATDSAHFDKRPDFGVSRIIKLVSFNSSLYMFSRIPYRLYVSIKMTVREGRRKWSSTRKDLNLFPVYKFIKVHQKAKL